MSQPSNAIQKLQRDLESLQKGGHSTIEVENLQAYLSDAVSSSDADFRERELINRNRLVEYEALHKSNLAREEAKIRVELEGYKVVVEASKEAINAAMIVNGGAAIAILGFLGALASKGGLSVIGASMAGVMASFAFGVFLAAVAFGCRYFMQYFDSGNKNLPAIVFQWLAVSAVSGSYVAFGLGAWNAYSAFQHFFQP